MTPPAHRPVLALDGVSPLASAAVALGGETLAEASIAAARSSTVLLALVADTLRSAAVPPAELAGLVVVAGPGSFTGTRVTLSTALGLTLATGAPSVAVSTLEALALAAGAIEGELLAAVDALRGDWFVQRFAAAGDGAPRPLDEPRRRRAGEGPEANVALLVGFGLAALPAEAVPGAARREPGALAPALARAASRGRWEWRSGAPLRPIYLAPPAVKPAP